MIALGKVAEPEYRSKLEADYSEHLRGQLLAGEILDWWYEDLTLRVAHDCRLTIDFFVFAADRRLEAHEVKGKHAWEDSIIKLRAAADKFPLVFRLVTRSEDGEWIIQEVGKRKSRGSSKEAEISAEAVARSAPLPNTADDVERPIRNRKMRVQTPPPATISSDGKYVACAGARVATLNGKPITDEHAKELLKPRHAR